MNLKKFVATTIIVLAVLVRDIGIQCCAAESPNLSRRHKSVDEATTTTVTAIDEESGDGSCTERTATARRTYSAELLF